MRQRIDVCALSCDLFVQQSLQLIYVTRKRKLRNLKQFDGSRSPYLGILLVFLEIQIGISIIKRSFEICQGFFYTFRPSYVNTLGREYRPGNPLHKETRIRIIDLYLSGEGPTAISRTVRETPGAVRGIIRHCETFGTCEAFSQGRRSYPSKLSDDVLESIELLAKPSMYG